MKDPICQLIDIFSGHRALGSGATAESHAVVNREGIDGIFQDHTGTTKIEPKYGNFQKTNLQLAAMCYVRNSSFEAKVGVFETCVAGSRAGNLPGIFILSNFSEIIFNRSYFLVARYLKHFTPYVNALLQM